jgi:hypothetical protein
MRRVQAGSASEVRKTLREEAGHFHETVARENTHRPSEKENAADGCGGEGGLKNGRQADAGNEIDPFAIAIAESPSD